MTRSRMRRARLLGDYRSAYPSPIRLDDGNAGWAPAANLELLEEPFLECQAR
ncbi:MAG: hypothetical protein QM581_01315 [Pseudomonas sp.]